MKFLVLIAAIGCAVAAPTVKEAEVKPEPVPILKQINQLNDDGSYTFGFEAGDGSFRVETRDISGHIRGKYGYVDEDGQRQTLEYVSGKESGRALGFQPSGVLAPFPIVKAQPSAEQLVLDYKYSSVDLDEDGFPDSAPAVKAAYPETKQAYPEVKQAYPETKAAYPATPAAVEPEPVRVVVQEPAPVRVVVQEPAPVRVVVQQPVQEQTVRVVQAPLPVPVVRAPVPVFAPAPVQFAPAPVQFAQSPVQFAQQPVQFVQSQQQVFRVSGRPTVVDQQFLEDLQNQSVDADEDGQPDQAVQIFQGPSAQLPVFGARVI